MATKTVHFEWIVDGVFTNVTAIRLSDPTGAYGVKRVDTGGIVVPNDTPIPAVVGEIGIYEYAFTEPAVGLTYNAYIEVEYLGALYRFEKTLFGARFSDTPFLTSTTFQKRYDSRLIAQLSGDANTGVIDTEVVQICLNDADAMIRSAAHVGSQYTNDQLNLLGAGDNALLQRLCADGAILFLFQRRGAKLPGPLRETKDRFNDMLDRLRKGQRVLDVDTNRTADLPSLLGGTQDLYARNPNLVNNEFFAGTVGDIVRNG